MELSIIITLFDMDRIDTLRKDIGSLQNPTVSSETKQQILDSIYFRFKNVDAHITKDIEESFRQIERGHQHSASRVSSESSLKLPQIKSSEAAPPSEYVAIQTQRKILQQIIQVQSKDNQKDRAKKPKKPIFKHLYSHSGSLSNLQKYYCFESVPLTEADYAARGIYGLINAFRTNNVDIQYLEPAKPKAFRNKLSNRNYEQKLSNISVLAKSSNFRTTIKMLGEEAANPFITNPQSIIKEQKSEASEAKTSKDKTPKDKSTGKTTPEFTSENMKVLVFEDLSYLKIHNYRLVSDQEMELFKLEHLPSWGRILSSIYFIIRFLRKYRLKSATIRGSLLLEMDCVNRRVPEGELVRCLASPHLYQDLHKDQRIVDFRRDPNLAAAAIQKVWRGVIQIKRANQVQLKMRAVVAKVACLWRRKMMRQRLKIEYSDKVKKCAHLQRHLHERWADYSEAIEVHIPSFSLSEWHRLTTHHMTSFQSQISRIWRSNSKSVIVVLPSANQKLLAQYFRRIQTSTIELNIIVPQNISLFPAYLPLSSVLYYSFGSLSRIKSIVGKRKAYIVPGQMGSVDNEILLSSYLNMPLYCSDVSLLKEWRLYTNYIIFKDCQLPTLPCEDIEPGCCLSLLAAKLMGLIIKNPRQSLWLLKIEGEFLGRGIAALNLTEDKQIQRFLQQSEVNEENCHEFHNLLTKFIQHRLVCCEHLYRKEEFLASLLSKGGIIEAQVEKDPKKLKTYEVCVNIEPTTFNILGVFRCIQTTPFCNQSFIREDDPDTNELARVVCSQISRRGFRGFCSFSFVQPDPADNFHSMYMIDIKPYLTSVSCSTFYFSKPAKYIFLPQISHANIQNSDPIEVMASSKKGISVKDHENGCLVLTMGNAYSMVALGKELVDIKKCAVEMLRYIQYRGTSTLSGEKQFVRGDHYSLSEIAASLKAL